MWSAPLTDHSGSALGPFYRPTLCRCRQGVGVADKELALRGDVELQVEPATVVLDRAATDAELPRDPIGRITLQDQIPVSTNSGITVEALELSGGSYNAASGKVSWDYVLKPQETKQTILTWSAKYPKDKTVILE